MRDKEMQTNNIYWRKLWEDLLSGQVIWVGLL